MKRQVTIEKGDIYDDAGAEATDEMDGDLTKVIQVSGDDFDTNVPGTYTIAYTVTDAAGNEALEVEREVVVVDVVQSTFTATATTLIDDWFYHSWFGNFYVKDANWIFHESLGWVYVSTLSTNNSAWLYLGESLGWCWTSSTIFPLFSQSSPLAGGFPIWFYHIGSSSPRYFFNFATQSWGEG